MGRLPVARIKNLHQGKAVLYRGKIRIATLLAGLSLKRRSRKRDRKGRKRRSCTQVLRGQNRAEGRGHLRGMRRTRRAAVAVGTRRKRRKKVEERKKGTETEKE